MFDVLDPAGQPQTLAWLYQEFGSVVTQVENIAVDPPWKVIAVQDSGPQAPASIGITCLAENGLPAPGTTVVFFWPDAPGLPGCGFHGRGIAGITNGAGYVGFDVGPGAYYDPHAGGGPHQVWIYGANSSEAIAGLGMIAGTNHRHLNVTFQRNPRQDPTPDPGPTPGPDPNPLPSDTLARWAAFPRTVADRLDLIAGHLDRIAAALETR